MPNLSQLAPEDSQRDKVLSNLNSDRDLKKKKFTALKLSLEIIFFFGGGEVGPSGL